MSNFIAVCYQGVKWFLRKSVPPIDRILLVESGSRAEAQRLVPLLRESVCGNAPIDLFTCLPDEPSGLGTGTRAWRSYEARNHSERWRMLLGLRRERHTAAAILCGDSPLLAIWKLALAALLPAKILLVAEGEGLIWLDRAHWRKALELAISRSGVRNPEFLRKAAHVAFLPIGLTVLVAFAAKVHLVRLIRATRFTGRPDVSL